MPELTRSQKTDVLRAFLTGYQRPLGTVRVWTKRESNHLVSQKSNELP